MTAGVAMTMQDGMERVIVHLGEARAYRGRSLVSALLEFLLYSQVRSATVTREGAGIGPKIGGGETLHPLPEYPVQVEFVERAEMVRRILPRLEEMAAPALIEVQPVEVAIAEAVPESRRSRCEELACTSISIWVGEAERWRNRPLNEALVESLHASGIRGATVVRAVAGYAGACAGRPFVITAVDRPERVQAWLPVLASMAPQAVVVLSAAEGRWYRQQVRESERKAA